MVLPVGASSSAAQSDGLGTERRLRGGGRGGLSFDLDAVEDGTWTVTLHLELGKREADEVGEETDLSYDEVVEIGVYAGTREQREPLLVERRRLQGPEATVTVTVASEPTLAGVDPNHLLLDQRRDDNLVRVTSQ